MRKGSGANFNTFNDSQKDKMIEILEKNEDNSYKYHTEKLRADKEIELAKIGANITNQKTLRIVLIGVILVLIELALIESLLPIP